MSQSERDDEFLCDLLTITGIVVLVIGLSSWAEFIVAGLTK